MDILYIVMPAYNEEDNIIDVVTSWYPVLEGKDPASRIVVADSGSQDRTHDLLEDFKKDHPQLEILSNTDKQHGPKVIALYDYAIKDGADFIFQTDSDGQTMPGEFDGFWQMRHGYKGIFGNRIVRGDGKSRAFVEKVVCFLVKRYFHVKVPDANAPFRLMNAQTVAKYLPKLDDETDMTRNLVKLGRFSEYCSSYILIFDAKKQEESKESFETLYVKYKII